MKHIDLKELFSKYKARKGSVIALTIEGDELVINEVTAIDWSQDYWRELERIKL